MITASREYIEIMASALTQKVRVGVKSSDKWAFDVKNQVFYYNADDLLHRDFLSVRALVLHELGHCLFTPFTSIPNSVLEQYPMMHDVYNFLEDLRIERRMAQEFGFEFAGLAFDFLNAQLLGKQYPTLAQNPPLRQTLLAWGHDFSQYAGYAKPPYRSIQDFQSVMDEESYGAFYKLTALTKGYLFDIKTNAYLFSDVIAFANDKVFPIVKELLEENKNQSQSGEKQVGEKKEGAKTQSQDGKNIVKLEPKLGSGDPLTEEREKVQTTGVRSQAVPSYEEAVALTKPYSSVLSARVGDVLKEHKSVSFSGAWRSGKLLSRNTTKVITGENRPFSKRKDPDAPDYKVYIMLDGSGSMREHQKNAHAYLATVMLFQALKKIGLEVEVWKFGENARKIATNTSLQPEFMFFDANDNHTYDDDMVLDLLKARKHEQKEALVFIIGDGIGSGELNHKFLTELQKNATLLAFGIGEDCEEVASRYPNGKSCKDTSELPILLMQTLKQIIHR